MADVATLKVTVDASGTASGTAQAGSSIDALKVKAGEGVRANKELGDSLDSVGDSAGKLSAALSGVAGYFALRAAKDAIEDVTNLSTRYQELGIATQFLGSEQGVSLAQMRVYEQQLQQTGFSGIAAREALTTMSAAQLDLSKTQQLGAIAAGAAVNRNLDFGDALNMVVRGIESGRTVMLRQMGIVADFTGAYKKMADGLGENVKQLTQNEQMQARVNAVVAAGSGLINEFAQTQSVAGGQLRLLAAVTTDVKTALGDAFQPALMFGITVLNEVLGTLKDTMGFVRGAAITAAAGLGAFTLALGFGATVFAVTKFIEELKLGIIGLQLIMEGASLASLGFAGALATVLTGAAIVAAIVAVGVAIYELIPKSNAGAEAIKNMGGSMENVQQSYRAYESTLDAAIIKNNALKDSVVGVTEAMKEQAASQALTAGKEAVTNASNTQQTGLTSGATAFNTVGVDEAKNLQAATVATTNMLSVLRNGRTTIEAFDAQMQAFTILTPGFRSVGDAGALAARQILEAMGQLKTGSDKPLVDPKTVPELEKTRNAIEQLNAEIVKGTVEQLKMSGDLVGAAQAQEAAEDILITTKYTHIGVQDKLAGSLVKAAIAAAEYVAHNQIQNAMLAEQAKRYQDLITIETALLDVTTKGSELALQASGQGLAADELAYQAAQRTIDVKAQATVRTLELAAATGHLSAPMALVEVVTTLLTASQAKQNLGMEYSAALFTKQTAAANELSSVLTSLDDARTKGQELDLQLTGNQSAADDVATAATLRGIDAKAASTQRTLDLAVATGKLELAQYLLESALNMVTTAYLKHNVAAERALVVAKELPTIAASAISSMQGALTQFVTEVTGDSRTAFKNLFDNILKDFLTMVAQMEERNLLRALFGNGDPDQSTQSILTGVANDLSNWFSKVAKDMGKQLAGALAGAAVGITVGQSGGGALGGAASGALTGFAVGGPVGGIVGGVAGLVSGLLSSSKQADIAAAEAAKAAADMAKARQTFQDELTQFVQGINDSGTGIAGALKAIQDNRKTLDDATSAGVTASQGHAGALPSVASFAGTSDDELTKLIASMKQFNPVFSSFLQQILDARHYSEEATAALRTTFSDALHTRLNASLGDVGKELNSLADIATQRANDIKDATTLGVLPQSQGTIDETFVNNTKAFFAALNTSQLDTLLPSLTGDTLAWATAVDVAKHAADDAAQALKDQATQTGYLGRIAQATGSAADALAARRAEEDAAMSDLVANHASQATKDMLLYTESIEDNATASALAAKNLATSTQFSLDILKRSADLTGDPEAIKYANLAVLQDAQQTELLNATKLLETGVITTNQFNALAGFLQVEFNHALTTVDGTINGITTSAQALADAAKILSDNVASLNQQFDVMGTGLQDQITALEHAYGLDGLSLTDLRALFTQTTLGQELTPAQQAMNDHIQQIVDLIYKLPAAATATTTDSGSGSTGSGVASFDTSNAPGGSTNTATTAATANTTPIIVMDGNIVVQIMVDPNSINDGDALASRVARGVSSILYRRTSLQIGATGSLTPLGGQ